MAAGYFLACFMCMCAMIIGNFKAVESFVCPKDYCATVNCVSPVSCPPGYALAPTWCGCCKDCVPIIRK